MFYQITFIVISILFLITPTTSQAAEKVILIDPITSGRLYANYTHGDCCDLDAFTSNESMIPVGPCATKGGYCMSGTKIASWMFAMPALDPGSTLLSASFQGRHTGGSTTCYWRGKWFSDGSHGYNSAQQGWNYPGFTGSAGSSGGYFSSPLSIEFNGGTWTDEYLLLSVYRGTYLQFYNGSTTQPIIRLVVGMPEAECQGDVNDDSLINIADLLMVIEGWSSSYSMDDLLTVLAHWGSECTEPGACCLPTGGCEWTDAAGCKSLNGSWNGPETYCSAADCPDLGACCIPGESGVSCEVLLSDVCKSSGGSFRGADTDCETTDCSIPEYNDECVDAIPVANGTTAFSTLDATVSSDVYSDALCPNTYLGIMNADVWFSYEATCTGMLSVSTCDVATFDTDIVVYEGTCSQKKQIACNGDSTCTGYTSYLETSVTQGESYLIRVGGWDGNSAGTGSIIIECVSEK